MCIGVTLPDRPINSAHYLAFTRPMHSRAMSTLQSPRRDRDLTALTHWFPLLEAAGLPVPRTIILEMPEAAQRCIWAAFDGKDGTPDQGAEFAAFVERITEAAASVGFPAFLRTAHTSGKHQWKSTCYLTADSEVAHHIYALAEFSEIADFMGLPWDTWVVREFLPTSPVAVCPYYGDMPVTREFRFFITDGEIVCEHPYWPDHAIVDGGADLSPEAYTALCDMPDAEACRTLARAAGRAVPGSWSIGLLHTARGWFVTDMAEAAKSWHWPNCEVRP